MSEEHPADNAGNNAIWNEDFKSSANTLEAEPSRRTAPGPNGVTYYIMDVPNGRFVATNTGGITFWPRPI